MGLEANGGGAAGELTDVNVRDFSQTGLAVVGQARIILRNCSAQHGMAAFSVASDQVGSPSVVVPDRKKHGPRSRPRRADRQPQPVLRLDPAPYLCDTQLRESMSMSVFEAVVKELFRRSVRSH